MTFTFIELIIGILLGNFIITAIDYIIQRIKVNKAIKENGMYISCNNKIYKSIEDLEQYIKEHK